MLEFLELGEAAVHLFQLTRQAPVLLPQPLRLGALFGHALGRAGQLLQLGPGRCQKLAELAKWRLLVCWRRLFCARLPAGVQRWFAGICRLDAQDSRPGRVLDLRQGARLAGAEHEAHQARERAQTPLPRA